MGVVLGVGGYMVRRRRGRQNAQNAGRRRDIARHGLVCRGGV